MFFAEYVSEVMDFRGRIGRSSFWFRAIYPVLLYVVTTMAWSWGAPSVAVVVGFGLAVWCALSTSVKRAKDVFGSYLGLLVAVVPLVNLLVLGFAPGQSDVNQFGYPPDGTGSGEISAEELESVRARISGQ